MFDNLISDNLSEIDRSIIFYIINNPDLCSLMRVRDLAEATHVSPATIIRFVKRVGYDSFTALKVDIRKKLVEGNLHTAHHLSQHSHHEPMNFDADFDQKIDQLVKRLETSHVTYCVGLGSSGIMAEYCTRLLNTLGFVSLSSKDGHLPYFWSKDLKHQNNNLIVFSTSGETRELVGLVQNFGDRAPIFVTSITNHNTNSLASVSDLNISYYITPDRLSLHVDLTSQIPALYIIETIIRKLHANRINLTETL